MITSSVSCFVSISVCLSTPPVPDQVLRRFYRFARPPGAWYAIKTTCFTQDVINEINEENYADLACTGIIAMAQAALYVFAVSLVAKAWTQTAVLFSVLCILSPLIYFKWYAKLKDRPVGLSKDLHQELLD